MRATNRAVSGILAVLVVVSSAAGELLVVDADAHPPGADISDLFPGVTLAALGTWGELDHKVYARQAGEPAFASTGANVFGHNASGTDEHGRPRNETWRYPDTRLGVYFHNPANFVTIDVIGDDGGDIATVNVFDAAETLLELAATPRLDYGTVAQIEISRDAFDITFVILTGTGGSAVYIDNLQANVIPEPATVLLLGSASLILRKRRA